MSSNGSGGGSAEFDRYVRDYRDIINEGAKLTGENFEYFIGVRLGRMHDKLAREGALGATRRILDFGCGIGATAVEMRRRFPDASITGIDTSPESVRAAEALGVPDASFRAFPGGALPFGDASFDAIYSNGTFHHIPHGEHPLVLSELRRVLRPGGHAFLFENNPWNPLMVREMHRNPFDRDAKMVFPSTLRRRMRAAGFALRTTNYYVFYPKQLRALRPTEPLLRHLPLGAQYFVWGQRPV